MPEPPKIIVKGRCSRWDCPTDVLEVETFVIRELRMAGVIYTCVVCDGRWSETNTPGGLLIEYLEPRKI